MERHLSLDYAQAQARQAELVALRKRDQVEDHLLLLEHPPVITLGKESDRQFLHSSNLPVHSTNRGGSVTYHGPGQLVAYPILKLEEGRRDLHRYLRDLEEILILTCRDFGVTATRSQGRTGIWVGQEKLASIGVRASSWVTSHGVALNYDRDLEGFDSIVPCGLTGVKMTSLGQLLGKTPSRELIEEGFCRHFQGIMNRTLRG